MDNFIGDNINALRAHKGLSQQQLANIAEVSQATVSAWEAGTNAPRSVPIRHICDKLNISYDAIMSKENGFAKTVTRPANNGFIKTRLYGSIAAGDPLEMQAVNTTFPIPAQMAAKYPDAFLLKVEGDSMSRILPNGCYALINPCNEIEHDGEPYAVCVNGYDATIKRVKKLNNGFQLVPDSLDPTYKTETFNYNDPQASSITVIGEVVYYVLPFDWSF